MAWHARTHLWPVCKTRSLPSRIVASPCPSHRVLVAAPLVLGGLDNARCPNRFGGNVATRGPRAGLLLAACATPGMPTPCGSHPSQGGWGQRTEGDPAVLHIPNTRLWVPTAGAAEGEICKAASAMLHSNDRRKCAKTYPGYDAMKLTIHSPREASDAPRLPSGALSSILFLSDRYFWITIFAPHFSPTPYPRVSCKGGGPAPPSGAECFEAPKGSFWSQRTGAEGARENFRLAKGPEEIWPNLFRGGGGLAGWVCPG